MPKQLRYKKHSVLEEQSHELIMQHILDPSESPLPPVIQEQYKRVLSAAKMLDSYHPFNVVSMLQEKYDITRNTAYRDIRIAQELFKDKHSFDYDYWQQWQIKDLVETIRLCKTQNKTKERILAHKVLKDIIGDKIVGTEDPKRMENNTFLIQVNNNNQTMNIPVEKIKGLSEQDIEIVVESISTNQISDNEINRLLE